MVHLALMKWYDITVVVDAVLVQIESGIYSLCKVLQKEVSKCMSC